MITFIVFVVLLGLWLVFSWPSPWSQLEQGNFDWYLKTYIIYPSILMGLAFLTEARSRYKKSGAKAYAVAFLIKWFNIMWFGIVNTTFIVFMTLVCFFVDDEFGIRYFFQHLFLLFVVWLIVAGHTHARSENAMANIKERQGKSTTRTSWINYPVIQYPVFFIMRLFWRDRSTTIDYDGR